MTLSRRTMLIAAAAALAVPASREMRLRLNRRLLALMRPRASAAAVGRAYLARFPGEADPLTLTRLILDGLGLTEAEAARLGEAALRRRVAAGLSDDFAAGRTAMVEGWILSRTEARLCALAAAERLPA